MSDVYDLSSFDAGTSLDRPASELVLPYDLRSGAEGLCLVDAVATYPDRPARVQRPAGGMLALRVGALDAPVEVVVVLTRDQQSGALWRAYQDRLPAGHPRDAVDGTRLALVQVAGGPPRLGHLAVPGRDRARTVLTFSVRPEDLGSSPYLTIEVRAPDHELATVVPDLVPDALVGLCLKRVVVRAATRDRRRSSIHPGDEPTGEERSAADRLLVLNPSGAVGSTDLLLRPAVEAESGASPACAGSAALAPSRPRQAPSGR